MNIPIGDSIRYSWETVKQNLAFCVTAALIMWGAMVVAYIIPMILFAAGDAGMVIGVLFMMVASVVVGVFIQMAQINLGLTFCNGQVPDYSDMKKNSSKFGQMLIGTIVYGLMVGIGSIFCIVPGIYFAVKYFFYAYLIMDQDMDAMDAIKEAGELTKGSMMELLGFFIVLYLINMLGALCCGVGMLVSFPVVMIASAYMYRVLLAGRAATQQQYAQPPVYQ